MTVSRELQLSVKSRLVNLLDFYFGRFSLFVENEISLDTDYPISAFSCNTRFKNSVDFLIHAFPYNTRSHDNVDFLIPAFSYYTLLWLAFDLTTGPLARGQWDSRRAS